MFILAFEIAAEPVVLGKEGSGPTLNSITDVIKTKDNIHRRFSGLNLLNPSSALN